MYTHSNFSFYKKFYPEINSMCHTYWNSNPLTWRSVSTSRLKSHDQLEIAHIMLEISGSFKKE